MLRKNAYIPFTANEIQPEGWLKRQLEIQAEGLSGNLDLMWKDIRDSRWIGGDCDGWERVPYWLDGFIPLAYLLKRDDLISRAKRYIDAIIENQKADGWICPCEDNERSRYDMWACFLICKVLVVYHDCSGDDRIEGVLKKALYNLMLHIRGNTIFNWASARWFECLIPVYWLYERTHEEWLLYLAHMLEVQGTDYKALLGKWRDQKPHKDWNYQTHVVNLAMALKAQTLASRADDCPEAPEKAESFTKFMQRQLFEYHGTAYGHFTGDENLSGDSPIQGSELCGVVEAMYSYEQIFAITGNSYWLDCAERLAFNALPAATSPDMWTHQYDQLTNQIACVRFMGRSIFGTNNNEAHLFGLEPNFGCCTANFNQGWPKLALSAFMQYDNGILGAIPVPAKLVTVINGAYVTIECESMYPFRDSARYKIKTGAAVCFEFAVRIPGFAKSASVNGEEAAAGDIFRLRRRWEGEYYIDVALGFETELVSRPRDMTALSRGPLVYSVSIDEEWKMHEYTKDGVERKFPYCDYEIYPKSKWNYALSEKHADFAVTEHEISDYPFSPEHPPLTIEAGAYEIDWGYEEGYNDLAAKVPHSRKAEGQLERIIFKPYGCTDIRITEIPVIKD